MLGQIAAFLAVATVAFATTCGPCYSGYGRYETLNTGLCGNGLFTTPVVSCGAPVISSGFYTNPIVSSGVYGAVGTPEVISSCENSYTPYINAGLASFGGCGAGVVATAC